MHHDTIYFDGRHYDLLDEKSSRDEELAFYLTLARSHGGTALELGCGTGTLTIPMAEAGIGMTGIDISPTMLSLAREKAAARGVRIAWRQGDVRGFHLSERFGLIYFPINSLLHLLDRESLDACFACVKRHLLPDGAFAFEVFNPSFAMLTRNAQHRYPVCEYDDPDGRGRVVVTENNTYDAAAQINHVRYYYRVVGSDEETVADLNMRILYPQELDACLHYNGFVVEAKYGDFTAAPFTSMSRAQILICRVAAEAPPPA